ncbi:MAG TPA: class I SAM-dependent methyltransferase [Patescibacteria group bacterium]|nr:class I SAM-dependent methyltransferase [Patescibacteria group bacterium]
MKFDKYYLKNKTFITFTDMRIGKIIKIIIDISPNSILDVGCGSGYLLTNLHSKLSSTKLYGIDIYPNKKLNKEIIYKQADITEGLPFKSKVFECVVLGEVIEHVPNPDFLLREINRVLKKDGILIISTPNLVSWANRVLVLLGVQPLFTETSNEVNLGRKLAILGQGAKVQGHLKIFTSDSLTEILEREKFKIINKHGVTFFFPFPISLLDKFFTKFITLSSGLLYVVKK